MTQEGIDRYTVDGTTDYYAALGLTPRADEAAIARACARLIPDDLAAREAAAVLRDPELRLIYEYMRGPQGRVHARRPTRRPTRPPRPRGSVAASLVALCLIAGPAQPALPAPRSPIVAAEIARREVAPKPPARRLFGVCVDPCAAAAGGPLPPHGRYAGGAPRNSGWW